jgi:hypothetical protein
VSSRAAQSPCSARICRVRLRARRRSRALGRADAPAIIERAGVCFGFLQRSSVYWPTNHEATADAVGIAVVRGHTAYQIPMHRSHPAANRPGIPPDIITWADPLYLRWLEEDINSLRGKADVVVASFHWGLYQEILQYMKAIAHRAVDAGADIVMGHGPHFSLPVEIYRGKPIFYGLGSFSFHTGHRGRRHGDWLGMMARVSSDGRRIANVGFQFVRHDDLNRTVLRTLKDEGAAFDEISTRSAELGARLIPDGDQVRIDLGS